MSSHKQKDLGILKKETPSTRLISTPGISRLSMVPRHHIDFINIKEIFKRYFLLLSIMIDSYSFGNMKVDGKSYDKDLIIFPDKIKDNWWREDGHSLSIKDLDDVLEYDPEVLVVGQGANGKMIILEETKQFIEESGIILVAEKTNKAVEIFNEELERGTNVVGAFHLTC